MTRLVASELTLYGGAAAAPIGPVRHQASERYGVLLTLTDEDGRVGQGEASPLPGYSRETLDEVVDALRDVHERLASHDIEPWVDHAIGDALALPPTARFALDTALLDLSAQRKHVSMHWLFPGAVRAREVPVNAYAGAALDTGLVETARRALARGIRVVKVKLAGDDERFERERGSLLALRSVVGDAVELRLDANGAWSLDEARRKLERLAAVKPSFVEQPVARGSLRALGECAVPWAADESLSDPEDRAAVLGGECSGCAAVILKPAMHGLVRAWEMAREARAHDLGVVVTHLFDGPVALAAACELALAFPEAPLACGLDLHSGLAAWPELTIPQRAMPAVVRASRWPGLGVERLPRLPSQ